MNYTHIPIIFLIFLSTTTFATVGGKQTLQFLGYDQAAQKLYLLRHYEDESGRLPQLYYYHLKTYTSKRSKIQPQLIEVKSLYINPKNQKIDNNQDDTHFFKELDKMWKPYSNPIILKTGEHNGKMPDKTYFDK